MRSIIDWVLAELGRDKSSELHPLSSLVIGTAIVLTIAVVIDSGMRFFARKRVSYRGKHCYVTGGSKGTGKALAMELYRRGANVTIVARNKAALDTAAAEIRACGTDGTLEQRVHVISADMTDYEQAAGAVRDAAAKMGCPDFVFTCAGQALPGMFLEQDPAEFRRGMDLNYFGTLFTIQTAAKLMVEHNVRGGRLVMVASVLGLFGFNGYSQYVPSKFALRGLAEVLDLELRPHNIAVHVMFPGNILSEGYIEEQKRKPEITKIIEAGDEGQTPAAIAKALLKGVGKNQFFITSDFVGEAARCYSAGMAPGNGLLGDSLLRALGAFIFPTWRWNVARLAKNHSAVKDKEN